MKALTRRAHVILPEDVVAGIDRLVGKRGRSAFLADVAREEIQRRQQREALQANATYFLACQAASMDCGAGLHPARRFSTGAGRVTNPPQIANLPHNSRQIPGFGKSMWH
jgi:hypothetical protein